MRITWLGLFRQHIHSSTCGSAGRRMLHLHPQVQLPAPIQRELGTNSSGWWFGTCFFFPYIENNHPNWLIFFRGVQTTNQSCIFADSIGKPERTKTKLKTSIQKFPSLISEESSLLYYVHIYIYTYILTYFGHHLLPITHAKDSRK